MIIYNNLVFLFNQLILQVVSGVRIGQHQKICAPSDLDPMTTMTTTNNKRKKVNALHTCNKDDVCPFQIFLQ